jgi:hypothetical protein
MSRPLLQVESSAVYSLREINSTPIVVALYFF